LRNITLRSRRFIPLRTNRSRLHLWRKRWIFGKSRRNRTGAVKKFMAMNLVEKEKIMLPDLAGLDLDGTTDAGMIGGAGVVADDRWEVAQDLDDRVLAGLSPLSKTSSAAARKCSFKSLKKASALRDRR
jgi:hypothetical protein